MEFWIRDATLQIASNKYSLETMKFTFEVPFEDSEQLCVAKVSIHNLSAATRNSIEKGHIVIINAGYKGDIGCIFIGQVAGLSHKKDRTDWVTKITATVARDEWLNGQVYKTYHQGIDAKEMVADLLNIFGIEVSGFELEINKVYPRGRVCRGKLKDVLQEIVVSECKSRMLIRPTGQIIINRPQTGINMGFLLTEETGLLKTTDEYEVIPIQTDINTLVPFEEKEEDLKVRESLLNYHIGPADIIQVQSQSLNGRFMVVRGRHLGSRDGDWKTQMELKIV